MRAIWFDYMQNSNAPDYLKSSPLADDGVIGDTVVTFPEEQTYNAIGIGNAVEIVNGVEVSKAPSIIINGETVTLDTDEDANGLYMLSQTYTSTTVSISLPSQYSVGRIAVGMGRQTGVSPSREPGFWSSSTNRVTREGQAIAGMGGVSGRKQSVDIRYGFNEEIITDIKKAYPPQISRGFPLFISFIDCSFPGMHMFKRLYAITDLRYTFQSSVMQFLYSKKMMFTERF